MVEAKTLKLETQLLNGDLTVSEVSDEFCRKILTRFIRRHRNQIAQLEHQRRAQDGALPKLQSEVKKSEPIPSKK
jgi:HPt (histidine-containing phosphotransfer) domain-containing protein